MVLILLSINNIIYFPSSCTTGGSIDKFYVPSEVGFEHISATWSAGGLHK